jgi:membrane protein YdbS with pleckstrin-like domain
MAYPEDGLAHDESLKDAIEQCLAEARMVLPGIQALFGFQLIAVFNDRFDTVLGAREQALHLVAVVTIALAIVLIMTPAAYHRRTQRGQVSEDLLRVSSLLINLALLPLAAGLSIDIFVVTYAITTDTPLSATVAGLMAAALAGLWFVFPARAARHRRHAEHPSKRR